MPKTLLNKICKKSQSDNTLFKSRSFPSLQLRVVVDTAYACHGGSYKRCINSNDVTLVHKGKVINSLSSILPAVSGFDNKTQLTDCQLQQLVSLINEVVNSTSHIKQGSTDVGQKVPSQSSQTKV